MSTPTVTEIARRMEPVVRDTFVDDLRDPESPRIVKPVRPGSPR
jgi:hypothetical protein